MAFPSQRTAENINFFRRYRGQPEWNDQEIRDNYQMQNYVSPPLFKPPVPAFNPWPAPPPAAPAPALSPTEQNFINSAIPDLENALQAGISGGPGNWRGTKFLGRGSFGMVGLWEYQGPNPKTVPHRQVVVKESTKALPGSLRWEGRFLEQLHFTGSPHIAHILSPYQPVDAQAENINPAWDTRVKRLIMEYCHLGDLSRLLQRFQALGRPGFRETSLWKIFECLVDGIAVMRAGNEFAITNEPKLNVRNGWRKLVHLDLKLENIFLGEERNTHLITPVCKIGDFGLAWHEDDQADSDELFDLRRSGTQTFYAPEQFSELWEANDWGTTAIAGCYDTKTNVWGIGCIMYCLILMVYRGPDPKQPFTPKWRLNGKAPRGRAFGIPLRGQSPHYSRSLTDLVQECLYERPGHRPDLKELKTRVRSGFTSAWKADSTPDDWDDFSPPPPAPQVPRKRKRRLCKGTFKNGNPCRYRAISGGGGFCKIHQDQRP